MQGFGGDGRQSWEEVEGSPSKSLQGISSAEGRPAVGLKEGLEA